MTTSPHLAPASPGGTPSDTPSATVLAQGVDPYVVDGTQIAEPPTTLRGRLRFLGPGMITSAAVVGSGELLTATALGATVGFMLLWLVLVSTFLKVWVQIELARWSISTGRTAVDGYDDVPPRIGRRGWISWLQLLMFLQFFIGQAGVISASAFAFSTLLPIGGEPYSLLSIGVWVAALVIIAIAIHSLNRYAVVERISTVLVMAVTVFAIVMVFLMQATEFAWTAGDIAGGMRFQVAAGAIGVAIAMFGMTGVGAGETTAYTYWVVEKGYAAWAGPNDGTDSWVSRAKGWISVMKVDAWVSWIIYTASTAAFYILGAAVLHPQGLVPEGTDVMVTISSIFDSAVGTWGGVLFLIGAGLALFKTILANVPSLGRITGQTLAVFGAYDWKDQIARDRWQRIIMIVLPIGWGLLGTIASSPLLLVIIAGILNAVYLIGAAIATVYLARTQTDPRIRDGRPTEVMLWISAAAIIAVGVIGLVNAL
ncbi:Nramp family divalent metal transporter [Brachybacterium sp. J153]|uniref:Nramp family divalent metal transporter n=1 Tax=Brachybacterium sp. J153 TaxID=3116488 RepID=UPI002E75BAD7|nr:Nramp family divalent metal transporter [Brachybacterium sp. J153]MEE1616851.1 Nramp family divalent metal transporter [Brachybacterium sp. J153]